MRKRRSTSVYNQAEIHGRKVIERGPREPIRVTVPKERVQQRDDGITHYYQSRAVDVPMIATLAEDRTWVAASFARDPGNVWSNPELT